MWGARRPCPLAGRPALACVGPGRLPRAGVAVHPAGTVLQHGPGRVPPPSAAVLDPGLRPATTRCSWDPVLPCGGHPPPILPGLPQAELPLPMPPELQVGGRPPPMPPGPARARPPATSRCCVHPGRLLRPGLDPAALPPGRVPRPSAAVLDPGLRPATTRCSWGPVLPCGGRPPPSLVPGPGRPASCRAGLLRPPATTQCCRRPGSAGRARPASPGLRPSLLPVRPATSRCSAGPGCTGVAPAWGAPAPHAPWPWPVCPGPAACQPPVLPTPWPNSPDACGFCA